MNSQDILAVFKPFLWSYDVSQIDLKRDQNRIITNVLNHGTYEATTLLFKVYPRPVISQVVSHPLPGEWTPKSLNFWALVLGVTPEVKGRFAVI